MDRSLFLKRMAGVGCCAAMVSTLLSTAKAVPSAPSANMSFMPGTEPDELANTKMERDFILNWVNDLMDTMDKVLDEETYIKLIEGCGRGCYNRHQLKKDISIAAQGDLDKLLTAYKKNFEVWKEDDTVHIRYGEKSPGCYCPVLKNQAYNTKGMHCNCTKATHQAIFENALGRPFKVDILESVRRGGQTCHFLVHV
ncbi:MAG: hypothetical protein GZ094_11125 [Mariniphaga sp.]|nr:hypothetical protein [Mariniphaga sp.]